MWQAGRTESSGLVRCRLLLWVIQTQTGCCACFLFELVSEWVSAHFLIMIKSLQLQHFWNSPISQEVWAHSTVCKFLCVKNKSITKCTIHMDLCSGGKQQTHPTDEGVKGRWWRKSVVNCFSGSFNMNKNTFFELLWPCRTYRKGVEEEVSLAELTLRFRTT